jgi:hypothetical protein
MVRMAEVSRFTGTQKASGFGGLGLTLCIAALGRLMPDLPDSVFIAGLFLGVVLIAYAVIPHMHGWLAGRVGGCFSVGLLAVFGAAVTGGISYGIYEERSYNLIYVVCFNHMLADSIPYEPQIKDIFVAPRIINRNGFAVPLQVDEAALRIGTTASEETQLPKKLILRPKDTNWGYLDYVEFNPPITPGPVTGHARYVIHYGRDPFKPLDKTLVIEGDIEGAISPDGHVGGFTFTPAIDENYIQTRCVVPPKAYYVANKR